MKIFENRNSFEKFVIFWLIISIIFWNINIEFMKIKPAFLYLDIFLVFFGLIVLIFKTQIKSKIDKIQLKPFYKFMLIGYSMVLFEEIIAALVNTIPEGFSFGLWMIRILQFWAFNILAFTGFLLGWYFLFKRYNFSRKYAFFLAGCYGLYSEKVYLMVTTDPFTFIFYSIPVVYIYGLIIYPSLLSLEENNERKKVHWYTHILVYVVIILCSLIPGLILTTLRANFPYLFPPYSMI